ncbi:hypothetical protein ACX5I6_20375 [Arthrobacter sp. MMS24-T111]
MARSVLRTAQGPKLRLIAETNQLEADPQNVAFIRIEIADNDGVIEMLQDDTIEVEVEGEATLIAMGSSAPATTESYSSDRHSTYYGRALAIVRSTGAAGEIHVRATSQRHGTATVQLSAQSASLCV